MPTDNERREVARRLRRLNGNISHVRRVYEAEGIYTFCDDQADYYQICYAIAGYLPAEHMHPCDYEELHDRLADLIEPFGHECVPGECPINVRHDNDRIDRDALLSLADDIDKQTDGSMFDAWLEDGHYIARRIREALWVKHG